MIKDELWAKMYEKYHIIFNRDCEEVEDEGVELMKEYFYADVLPELFQYDLDSDTEQDGEDYLTTDLEKYVTTMIDNILDNKK